MGPKVESSASGSSPGVKYQPSTPKPIHASPAGSEGSRTGPPPPWGLLGSETQQLKKQPQSSPGRHSSGLSSHREDAGSGRQSGVGRSYTLQVPGQGQTRTARRCSSRLVRECRGETTSPSAGLSLGCLTCHPSPSPGHGVDPGWCSGNCIVSLPTPARAHGCQAAASWNTAGLMRAWWGEEMGSGGKLGRRFLTSCPQRGGPCSHLGFWSLPFTRGWSQL